MSYQVTIRPRAYRDLCEARDWYESRQSGLGGEFIKEVNSCMVHLSHRPEISPLYYRSFRRTLLHRFPYKVFYQILDSRVVVFRVLHAKQSHGERLGQ